MASRPVGVVGAPSAATESGPAGRSGAVDLNIAREALDRNVASGRGPTTALRCLRASGEVQDVTYVELARWTDRFAGGLEWLGVRPGETVFLLLDRVPELYVAALGALKVRAVVCPLFSVFGPEPVGAAVAPRAIQPDAHIPKTRSGKIMRRVLRARELGLPEGDVSTIEEPAPAVPGRVGS